MPPYYDKLSERRAVMILKVDQNRRANRKKLRAHFRRKITPYYCGIFVFYVEIESLLKTFEV
jgi:hypothetical protein